VEPPDILLIQASQAVTTKLQAIEGQHLVAPDGTVNLGIYGKVSVTGMTVEQVADAVAARLQQEAKPDMTIPQIKTEMQVDVLAYNSKFYYVITDGGGYGQQIYPLPCTGNEMVLDALAKVNGLPAVASKKSIWVARATRAGQQPLILPVDWRTLSQCGSGATNYQIFPGDRIYVNSDPWIRGDTWLAKRLSPILRGFGATLLGASTVNTIKNGTTFGNGVGNGTVR
jgi:polysaccharide export outer membrane protein